MGSQVTGDDINNNNKEKEAEGMVNLEEKLGSNLTLERVAAAKKFIEGHYKSHMKHIRERKERYFSKYSYSLLQIYIRVAFW